MAMAPRFELRQGQTQSLVMTPQLQQAIKLLQMSNLELTEYVEAELERNPLLEKTEGFVEKRSSDTTSADREPASAGEQNGAGSTETDGPDLATSLRDEAGSQATVDQLDAGLENVYADESQADAANRQAGPTDSGWSSVGQGSSAPLGEEFNFEATLTKEKTLSEHLTEQLNIAVTDPAGRMIGVHMIGALNETGYLTSEPDQIAETLGADAGKVEEVLAVVQTFDPAGIFARNLGECLAIQLREQDRLDPVMEKLLDNLELLAKHDFAELMKRCGADKEDLAEMIEEIRDCNPRPGSAFGHEVVQPVLPDVFVREATDGSWHVELNNETLPRVLVNNQYYANVAKGATREEDKTYLTECLSDANWLVKSLDQRARTILKVAREIVRQQDAFLVYGVQHLRPLNLKTVADAIEMHESTVSRVTSNKYMATPRGIFELKYFFTSAIASSAGGEAHSAEAVRQRIRDMIDSEDAKKILSDDRIVEMLNQLGIDIARRTVAKYREALGIPSSVQRRRQKKALG
ncbi:MAG: RNA polymerase factor sigma-54 [Pseudomonadota bacterium]